MGRVGTALAASVGLIVSSCGGGGSGSSGNGGGTGAVSTRFPVLFVTQVPIPDDFTNVVSTFGNHMAHPGSAPRGGDLWIRFPNGACKNLTERAGFGTAGLQGANAIAVREPAVHWSGDKAVFSMILGAPGQYDPTPYHWQLYEVSGLGFNDTPVITRVSNQPANYNNVSPCYASDDRILFASDRPRDGAAHLFPQRDEYEEQPTNTGLWSLDPATGELFLMQHSPSGSFSPSVDSFGRVIFTRWDHRSAISRPTTTGSTPTCSARRSLARSTGRTRARGRPRLRATSRSSPIRAITGWASSTRTRPTPGT